MDGLQARLEYNWRDDFLVAGGDGTGANPTYTEAYQQLDFNVSYDIEKYEGLTVFFEGINITEEELIQTGRFANQTYNIEDNGARYAVGVRGKF